MWRCRTIFNCTDACPRGIQITQAILEVSSAIVGTGRPDDVFAEFDDPSLAEPSPTDELPDDDDGRPVPLAPRGFVIRTDGAARGNPGPASLGAVLYRSVRPDAFDPRAPPGRLDLRVPRPPDEQRGRIHGRRAGARPSPSSWARREVELLLDSKLIVEQLHGRWRVKDAKLIPLWAACRRLLGGFERWTAAHVPRAQNGVADALANEAIDRVARGRPRDRGRAPRPGRAGSGNLTVGPSVSKPCGPSLAAGSSRSRSYVLP